MIILHDLRAPPPSGVPYIWCFSGSVVPAVSPRFHVLTPSLFSPTAPPLRWSWAVPFRSLLSGDVGAGGADRMLRLGFGVQGLIPRPNDVAWAAPGWGWVLQIKFSATLGRIEVIPRENN